MMVEEDIRFLLKKIEEETGFVAYENPNQGPQYVFYGTSANLAKFKELASDIFATGTIAYTMDDGNTEMYDKFNNTWW